MTASWDQEVDVLVIGAGGCGLAAAITARDEGARDVAIVEKFDRVGGNTAVSTGSVPGAGTRFQREAGIEDSAARMLHDLMARSGPHDVPELARILVGRSASLVEWLVDVVGARLALVTDYRHVGHSVPRLHAPRSRRGQDLVDDLVRAVDKRGIAVALANPVQELVVDAAGAVVGAVVEGPRTRRTRIGARKTVLAVDGFGANRDLVREHCPEIADARYFGAEGSTGEAVLWGRKLGAALANMGAYQGYAAVAYPHGSLLSWTTIEMGGLLVNARGQRFGDESVGYSGFAPEVMHQPTPTFAIFDDRVRAIVAREEEFRELLELGGARRADSARGLATAVGLDSDRLARTLDTYNEGAAGRAPDRFGRADFGLAPLVPPLYACQVVPGLFHTQGGLRIDVSARVLRLDGLPIPNLLAGGGAAAGISGRLGAAGYVSGNGLLTAIGLGRIAGRTAARELSGTTDPA
jgi:fumarate reductase flavoprotein subunit